jgi:AraC family transcriptional regulator
MTGGGRLVSTGRAHFSWDHLDRLLAAATGETPAVLRRRLLLERPAWQLAYGYTTADVEAGAGYRPTAAFARAFARAHGSPPSRHSGPFVITGHHRLLSQPEAVADLVLTLPG